TPESWPEAFMLSMNVSEENQQWAESMTGITYLHFSEFEKWKETQNTVANPSERGADYEAFKQEKANVFMREIEERYPHIKGKVKSVPVATPLSYRDYTGAFNGNLYGYIKDPEN